MWASKKTYICVPSVWNVWFFSAGREDIYDFFINKYFLVVYRLDWLYYECCLCIYIYDTLSAIDGGKLIGKNITAIEMGEILDFIQLLVISVTE